MSDMNEIRNFITFGKHCLVDIAEQALTVKNDFNFLFCPINKWNKLMTTQTQEAENKTLNQY